jgi:hypothetical protein
MRLMGERLVKLWLCVCLLVLITLCRGECGLLLSFNKLGLLCLNNLELLIWLSHHVLRHNCLDRHILICLLHRRLVNWRWLGLIGLCPLHLLLIDLICNLLLKRLLKNLNHFI